MSPAQADMADLGLLAGLAPELAATFASISGDIALVIGPDGVIRNVALNDAPLTRQADHWVGQSFIDTVTEDTRGKVARMLKEVGSTGLSRRREVNLPGSEGPDIPVAFAAIRLGAHGPVLAVGRDLRGVAEIQQRFVEAQQALERDHWSRRQSESRYRLLFQAATDAVLVVDAATLLVVEANRAAAELFGCSAEALVGLPVGAAIGAGAGAAAPIDSLLAGARASGRSAEIRIRLGAGAGAEAGALRLVDLSATPLPADGASPALLLLRARAGVLRRGGSAQRLVDFVEHTPDAVVITDAAGRVQVANPAFLQLCRTGMTEGQLTGHSLADALGDPGLQLDALLAGVRRQGIASQVRIAIGASNGSAERQVEVSAALMAEGDQDCIGLTLRCQPAEPALVPDALVAAIENLSRQLGRVSLPELMQQASHLAEQHLIRSALQQTGGHHATAAGWLGITPESLALRLRRHGLPAEPAAPSGLLN